MWPGQTRPRSRNGLAGPSLPCLVVAGTDSHPTLRAIAATLVRSLPDARFVELDGSGHVTYAEQPDVFARAVAAFATEIAGRQPTPALTSDRS